MIMAESMRELAQLLNAMRHEGVVSNYALFGAIAQMRYTEPIATLDADVLVLLPESDRLDVLQPIYEFCKSRGYDAEGEAIRVGEWPAQFIPAFNSLTREAVEMAETVDFEGVPFRVVRAVHLALIALSVGRAKDFARILSLMESDAVGRQELGDVASRHGLEREWIRFKRRFLDD
jgi:hypothetical protein